MAVDDPSLTLYYVLTFPQHVVEVFGLLPLSSGGFKQSGLLENSSLVNTICSYHIHIGLIHHYLFYLQALVNVDKKKELSEVSEKLANLFKGGK